eukprot:366135-Chlamydomonas_euryale.AAC.1
MRSRHARCRHALPDSLLRPTVCLHAIQPRALPQPAVFMRSDHARCRNLLPAYALSAFQSVLRKQKPKSNILNKEKFMVSTGAVRCTCSAQHRALLDEHGNGALHLLRTAPRTS